MEQHRDPNAPSWASSASSSASAIGAASTCTATPSHVLNALGETSSPLGLHGGMHRVGGWRHDVEVWPTPAAPRSARRGRRKAAVRGRCAVLLRCSGAAVACSRAVALVKCLARVRGLAGGRRTASGAAGGTAVACGPHRARQRPGLRARRPRRSPLVGSHPPLRARRDEDAWGLPTEVAVRLGSDAAAPRGLQPHRRACQGPGSRAGPRWKSPHGFGSRGGLRRGLRPSPRSSTT